MDDQRDQFFREVVGTVVVGAVGGQNRQAVGVVVGAHKVIAGRLAGRVGAVRFVLVCFGEGWVVGSKRAINFIGGNVQETEFVFCRFFQLTVEGTYGFEQAEGADDIGLNEVFRAVNAAVNMGFGSKIDDGTRLMFGQQFGNQFEIADVAFDEKVPRIAVERRQVFQVAGVGQCVEIDNVFI